VDPESTIVGYQLFGNRKSLGAMVPSTATAFTVSLPEGTTVLGVAAVNDAGLTGPVTEVSVTVDTVTPSAPSGLSVNPTTGLMKWSAPRDNGSALAYLVSMDGGKLTRVSGTQYAATLVSGRHLWSVRAVDAAGDMSPGVGTWVVKTAAVKAPVKITKARSVIKPKARTVVRTSRR
jgi:hypothetical protein